MKLTPSNIIYEESHNNKAIDETFVTRQGAGSITCHGVITEIESHQVFFGKSLKLINSLFRGEPYQLAHQTMEYVIRVQSPKNSYEAETMDFNLYGNFMGRLFPGDEVTVRARDYKDRKIVKSIINHTSNCNLKPGFQIPAELIRTMFILGILMLILLILGVYYLVESGMAANLLNLLISGLFTIGIITGAIIYGVKLIFRG